MTTVRMLHRRTCSCGHADNNHFGYTGSCAHCGRDKCPRFTNLDNRKQRKDGLPKSWKKEWLSDGSGHYFVKDLTHPVYLVVTPAEHGDRWYGYMELNGADPMLKTKKYKDPRAAALAIESKVSVWFESLANKAVK